MIDNQTYTELKPIGKSYVLTVIFLALLMLAGAWCAYNMEHEGHHITGMNNQVVWGLPHVFAIFLIVAASGALNAASLSSVFGHSLYKPYGRFSVALAITLLLGGLSVLVLDLGRPDRLVVAMTTFNFRSIFAWNVFLYSGFVAIGLLYLWVLMEKRLNRFSSLAGGFALFWRLALTTGTGCIFGFLVGRNALDSALLAPMFIAMSLAFGTACFYLILQASNSWTGFSMPVRTRRSLARFLMVFVLVMAYFSLVHHLTNLYVQEHSVVEAFTLMGPLAVVFWILHVGVGVVLPVVLLRQFSSSSATAKSFGALTLACISTIIGGLALVYVIVVGSQLTPQRIFPGQNVTDSRFGDATNAAYSPSAWEFGLGLGGCALALFLAFMAMRVLPFLPAVIVEPESDPKLGPESALDEEIVGEEHG